METFVPEAKGNHKCGLSGRALRKQRGTGKLKALLYTAILAIAIFAAWKILPAYVADYQLSDKIQEVARFGIVNHYTEEQIREQVYKTIQELGIPAKKEDIKVSADRQIVKISLEYRVPVDLIVYQMELHFTPSSENKSLT
jgi:cell division protein FtsL